MNLQAMVLTDGSLSSFNDKKADQIIDWNIGEAFISLDGDFTVDELNAIVIYMQTHQKKPRV